MKKLNKVIAVFSVFALAASFALVSGCSEGPSKSEVDKSKKDKIEAEEDKPIPSKSVGIID